MRVKQWHDLVTDWHTTENFHAIFLILLNFAILVKDSCNILTSLYVKLVFPGHIFLRLHDSSEDGGVMDSGLE